MAAAVGNRPPQFLQPLDYKTHPKKLLKLTVGFAIAAIPFSALVVLTSMSLKSDTIKALHGVTGKAILGVCIPGAIICTVTAGIFQHKKSSRDVVKREERLTRLEDLESDELAPALNTVREHIRKFIKGENYPEAYNERSDTHTVKVMHITEACVLDITEEDDDDEAREKRKEHRKEVGSPVLSPQELESINSGDNTLFEKRKVKNLAYNTKRVEELLYDYQYIKNRLNRQAAQEI